MQPSIAVLCVMQILSIQCTCLSILCTIPRQQKSPMALLGKVFRLLLPGTEAAAYTNTLRLPHIGLGGKPPTLDSVPSSNERRLI